MTSNLRPALDLIKQFEGFEAHAYPDPATGAEPITIGYGTTRYPDGSKVRLGDACTEAQATQWLMHEVRQLLGDVNRLVTRSISNNARCALVSFAYNVGIGNLQRSTLLKQLNSETDLNTVSQQFMRWNKANGKIMTGLTRRRAAEAQLFITPDALNHGQLPK